VEYRQGYASGRQRTGVAMKEVSWGMGYWTSTAGSGRASGPSSPSHSVALSRWRVGGLVLPNLAMRDKNSPYEFTAAQMGPYDIAPTAAIT
jgi:hypothetical protein